MKSPFSLSDDDLITLLQSYTAWYQKGEEDRLYPEEHVKRQEAIKHTLLDKSYLAGIPEDDLVRKILEYSKTLEGPATIRIGAPRVSKELSKIKRNLDYLIQSPDDPLDKAYRILEADYKIPVFAKAFWTPIFQAQFPDALPNWNNKTERFLKKVGINLSTSKLTVKDKYRLLSDAFVYLRQLDPSQNFHALNHLMHYGTVIQEGIDVLKRLTGEDETRYWQIAPGEGARLWNDFRENSLAAVGWNELDLDLKDVSRDELLQIYKEKYPNATEMEMKLGTTHLSNFMSLKPGDKIITNKGKRELLGVGEVRGTYIFKPDRKEYRHTVDVDYYKVSEEGIPIPKDFQGKFGKTIIPLKKQDFDTLEALFDHLEKKSIWWVNQGSTFAAAREGSFLWAPIKSKDGQPVYHWETMTELDAGDIVLHYVNGNLRCVSKVNAPAIESKRPESSPDEERHEDGRLVSVECHDLAPIIPREKFAEALSKLNVKQGPLDASGGIKQGYLFRLNLDALRIIKDSQPETEWPTFVKNALGDSSWIFQVNPKLYDLEGALKSLKELAFEINQHKNEIHVGHNVYLWQAGPNAGIVALAEVTTEPAIIPLPDFEKPFVRVPERFIEDNERAFVKVERVLDQPISKETMLNHHVLSKLTILKAPQGSNFRLTRQQADALNRLIGNAQIEPYGKSDALKDLFLDEKEFVFILDRLTAKKNLILQGPPGVGKTFIAKRLAYSMMGQKDDSRITMIQFHQSYSYEDFIQGFRPNDQGKFDLKNGLFYEFCLLARKQPTDKPHFLIIDEINRGNLSKIFGELLMLIEPDKRGPSFEIPLIYSKSIHDKFYVPGNLHLIGTMNTADRSLAMVDYALRRRFSFVYLEPKFASAKFRQHLKSYQVEDALIEKIVERMTTLNRAIADDTKNLGFGYQIGHSYFCPDKENVNYGEEWYHSIIRSEIQPLLYEYWFDDKMKADSLINGLL